MSLSGKVFIVTGAFGALGQAVTACMMAHGAKLDFTRWVSPKAVAEVIAFLVSDLARAISGATLPVAGRA
jgi:NAD(P)-dependent dehydrogenase (short-subunit alcohol dehydrogenase family)